MSTTIASSTTATSVIATVEALTTEFAAPSTCYSSQLTMLSSPGYQIWLNEPQPVPGTLYPNCYPSQWVDGYTSVYNSSSSIVPMMSPLVAPENWVTAQEMDNGYIALCPTGYQIHLPDDPVDTNRPAYGATCYSNFAADTTVVLSGFDSAKYTGTVTFVAKSTDQAYAHVIEGKKASSTASSIGATSTGTNATTSSSGTSSTTESASTNSSSGVSGGAIAGAVVGSIAGVALIALAIFFLFRRRRNQKAATEAQTGPEMGHGYQNGNVYQGNNAYHNGDKALPLVPAEEAGAASPNSHHVGAAPPYQSYAELPSHDAYEMESPQGPHSQPRELDTGYVGNELQNAGQNHVQRE